MARKRTRLMTMFSLVAVLALAGMGLTYTLWSETLEIDGTVNTGSVDVSIAGVDSEYVGVDANGGYAIIAEGDLAAQGYVGKENAANCSVTASAGVGNEHTGDAVNTGNGALSIVVDGAYPSFYCVVKVTVTNIGTVPVHVNSPQLVAGSESSLVGLGDFDGFDGECYDDDDQIHTNESVVCDVIIHFENNDYLNEGATYSFDFTILAHQWNESA